jgi:predicted SAM-dependent methyltransferase
MRFLNIGCGNLFVDSPDWENVDQNPFDIRVKAVNLTGQLPYADSSFEVIYSSHVLEHIDREYVPFLLSECFRLIKNGGIVRIVVPDFDEMVNSYLHHLNLKEWTEASFVKDS